MTGKTTMLSEEAVRSWAANPLAGEELVYAIGDRPASNVSAAVRRLAEAGAVTPHCRRINGTPQHLLRRVRRPVVAIPDAASSPRLIDLSITQQRVLAVLHEYAEAGLPCPTNKGMALLAGVEPGSVIRAFMCLRDFGVIRIDTNATMGRMVTIVSSGLSTARSAGVPAMVAGGGR